MYKVPHNELAAVTPMLLLASIIKWKPAQRTPNFVTCQGAQVAKQKQNEHFADGSWLSQPQGTSTAVSGPNTAPLSREQAARSTHPSPERTPGALAHHTPPQGNAFAFPFPSQVALPASTAHCTKLLESGGLQMLKQITQPSHPISSFQLEVQVLLMHPIYCWEEDIH